VEWIRLAQDRPVAGSFEHGNEPSGSINGREHFDQLSKYHVKKDSAPWK
jgi:hypothetical protein